MAQGRRRSGRARRRRRGGGGAPAAAGGAGGAERAGAEEKGGGRGAREVPAAEAGAVGAAASGRSGREGGGGGGGGVAVAAGWRQRRGAVVRDAVREKAWNERESRESRRMEASCGRAGNGCVRRETGATEPGRAMLSGVEGGRARGRLSITLRRRGRRDGEMRETRR